MKKILLITSLLSLLTVYWCWAKETDSWNDDSVNNTQQQQDVKLNDNQENNENNENGAETAEDNIIRNDTEEKEAKSDEPIDNENPINTGNNDNTISEDDEWYSDLSEEEKELTELLNSLLE